MHPDLSFDSFHGDDAVQTLPHLLLSSDTGNARYTVTTQLHHSPQISKAKRRVDEAEREFVIKTEHFFMHSGILLAAVSLMASVSPFSTSSSPLDMVGVERRRLRINLKKADDDSLKINFCGVKNNQQDAADPQPHHPCCHLPRDHTKFPAHQHTTIHANTQILSARKGKHHATQPRPIANGNDAE